MTVSVPTAPAPTPPVPPANDPGVLSKLLHAIGQTLNNPNDAGLLGMAQGFGAAAAPHMLTPVSMGQAFGMADQGAQQMRSASLQNAITQQALLPYQVMRTHALESSFRDAMNPKLPAHQRAAAAYRVDSLMGWNAASDPTVANRLAQIKAGYQPVTQGAGTTLTTAAKVAQGAGQLAHGAAPEGSLFDPAAGTITQAAGAPAVLAANAANKAGAAAAAQFPYQAGLSYHTRAPGVAGGTLGPRPGSFVPVQPPQAPNPAAQEQAMQRMIGLQMGVTNAAAAAGRPGPFPTTGVVPGVQQQPQQQPAPAQPPPQAAPVVPPQPQVPVVPAGGAPSTGLFAQGETPAALAAQKAIGSETATQAQEFNASADTARKQIALYNEMSVSLSKMGATGAWRDVTLPLAHIANYFGFTPGNITTAAEFQKYRVQLVGAATREVSPRASSQEMEFLAKQVPGYNMPGTAPRILLSQLRGLSQYQVVKNNAFTTYLQLIGGRQGGAFGGTGMGFSKWWVNHGPSPSAIVLASTLSGLPPAARGAYVGQLRKSATGRHLIHQYQRAELFEQQYPGVFQGL